MPEHETAAPPRPLAITQGDVAGIGPEIVAKVFRDDPGLTQGCFVVGSLDAMRRAARWVAKPGAVATPVALIRAPQEAVGVPPRCIPVLQLPGMDGELPAAGMWMPAPDVGRARPWNGLRARPWPVTSPAW